MTSTQLKICVYCGEKEATTDDHIPPKGIFPPDNRQGIISVPSCEGCNHGAQEDDEYFRNIMSSMSGAASHPEARKLFEQKIKRSIENPRQRHFWEYVRNQLIEVAVHTKDGIYLGNTPAFRIGQHEVQRIEAVIGRIVRGLYWKLTNTILPKESDIGIKLPDDVMNIENGLVKYLFTLERHQVGNGVFTYSYQFMEQIPQVSTWLLVFFEAIPFVCVTNKAGLLQRKSGGP